MFCGDVWRVHKLFHPEYLTLDDFVDKRLHPKMAGTSPFEDLLHFLAIPETNRRAGGINKQLAGQVAGDLCFIGEEEAFEFGNVSKLATVGQGAAGIDGLGEVELKWLPILAVALLMFAFAERAVLVAPAAED